MGTGGHGKGQKRGLRTEIGPDYGPGGLDTRHFGARLSMSTGCPCAVDPTHLGGRIPRWVVAQSRLVLTPTGLLPAMFRAAA
eukprot:scaffold1470_cov384-Prasinococcus_capsulatus_cf.AAC.3